MDAFGREDMVPDDLIQRHQGCGRCTYPVRERRDVEFDAFSGIDVTLAMQRQMQAVLGDQNVRQQLGSGAAARDRVRGRGWLTDGFAAPEENFSRTC
jgi:hypothetical protein